MRGNLRTRDQEQQEKYDIYLKDEAQTLDLRNPEILRIRRSRGPENEDPTPRDGN